MDVPQIKDREHLEAWLKTRSREECIAIAHRAAMRVAPLWIGPTLSSSNHTKPSYTIVLFLRALLISGDAVLLSTAKIKEAASAVFANYTTDTGIRIDNLARLGSDSPESAAIFSSAVTFAADAAESAALTVDTTANAFASDTAFAAFVNTVNSAEAAGATADAARAAADSAHATTTTVAAGSIWESVWQDLIAFQAGANLFKLPLLHTADAHFSANWTFARDSLVTRGPDWDFWVRWYDAALRGEPLNWKMQEEIALLPPEVWEGDVAGLAAAIAKIEHKYSLLDQIAFLKAKLLEAEGQDQIFDPTLAHRWHNNPPEVVNTIAEVRDQFALVMQALDSAEVELKLPNPDPSVIKTIGTVLLEAGRAIIVYCGGLAHVMLQKAAEEIGVTGTKVVIYGLATYFFAQAEPIQSKGKSMMEYALRIASGG